jgi:hypothetical protein
LRFVTAPLGLPIKIVTGLVLILEAGLFVAAVFLDSIAILPAAILGIIIFFSYLRSPIAYDLSSDSLVIVFRFGEKNFGRIVTVNPAETSVDRSIRLWGNGGLFSATGIFWNGTWGIYRAYITHGGNEYLVLVVTEKAKVLVSPDDPKMFVEIARASALGKTISAQHNG